MALNGVEGGKTEIGEGGRDEGVASSNKNQIKD